MTWKSELFRQYYVRNGSTNSAGTYASNIRKADKFCGGLDEKIADAGPEAIRLWVDAQTTGPFDGANATNVRSAVKKYILFSTQLSPAEADELFVEADVSDIPIAASVFRYEQELQAAVRQQIDAIEPGLTIADGGTEKSVPTGRIDILARDRSGCLVVIELKAGLCPKGAIEQILGYASDVEEEGADNAGCRTVLIAGEFSDRMLSAAKRVHGLTLMTYGISLKFEEAS